MVRLRNKRNNLLTHRTHRCQKQTKTLVVKRNESWRKPQTAESNSNMDEVFERKNPKPIMDNRSKPYHHFSKSLPRQNLPSTNFLCESN